MEEDHPTEMLESSWSPARRRLADQVGMLISVLRSPEEGVQELAIVQLSILGPKVVPHLVTALEQALDEGDLWRSARQSTADAEREVEGICKALGVIGDIDAIIDLSAALPRREAIEALAKIGGDRALELVVGAMENDQDPADADPAFVRRVFLAFGERGRKRLHEELQKASGQRRTRVAEIIGIMRYSEK